MNTIKKINANGFSLIEVIAVLVIMGILAVGLSVGLIKGVEQYLFANEANSISQKAQLAMARIKKELTGIIAVDSISGNLIRYTRPYSPPSCQNSNGCTFIIQKSGSSILLTSLQPDGSADSQTLIDHVLDPYPGGNVFLALKNFSDATWTVESGNAVNDLAKIQVVLNLTYGAGNTIQFDATINPRQGSKLNAPKLTN
jgi:prepilin-type N-terminal cleavage/methylation domain-containing protein